ncbi:MAG TPA: ATP-binding protein [Rhodothermales bacterium]|nr:ATP-binding protein [Rhodothermales bacterium]
MNLGTHRFSDLGTVIDRVHALFSGWEEFALSGAEVDVQALCRVKLAAHEWLANLVQHATFDARCPEISLQLRIEGDRIDCTIEDNSDGFDLEEQLMQRNGLIEPYPERGMGLLMLNACTDELDYQPVDDNKNRLTFTITVNKDPWLEIPFHT